MKVIIERLTNIHKHPSGLYFCNERNGLYIFDEDIKHAIVYENETLAEKKQFEMSRLRGLSTRQVPANADSHIDKWILVNSIDGKYVKVEDMFYYLTDKVGEATIFNSDIEAKLAIERQPAILSLMGVRINFMPIGYTPMSQEDVNMIQSLLNKVNAITAYWRHNHMIPPNKLDDLTGRQIEFEKYFESRGIKL